MWCGQKRRKKCLQWMNAQSFCWDKESSSKKNDISCKAYISTTFFFRGLGNKLCAKQCTLALDGPENVLPSQLVPLWFIYNNNTQLKVHILRIYFILQHKSKRVTEMWLHQEIISTYIKKKLFLQRWWDYLSLHKIMNLIFLSDCLTSSP